MNCVHCGVDEDLPFTCNYCGKTFCPDHRLPENHDCQELWRSKRPYFSPGQGAQPKWRFFSRPVITPYRATRLFWFSKTELLHLAIGAALVLAVGLNWMSGRAFGVEAWYAAAGLFAFSFLIHELAHKYVAQRHGLWAEFRVVPFGAVITLFAIFSRFPLVAPGAVMIGGIASVEVIGRIALAGPVTNILLAYLFYFVSGVLGLAPSVNGLFFGVSSLNAFIATFNMIPLGPFDGAKIMAWNKRIWAITLVLSIIPLIITWLL